MFAATSNNHPSSKLSQLNPQFFPSGQRRVATPVTPHPPPWTGTLGITDLRPRMLTDGLESDWSGGATLGGLPTGDRGFLNGQQVQEGQVDMLDIPGKGRCSVYIARLVYIIVIPSQSKN